MMTEILTPFNILMAGIAIFLFWRLWSVLGTRTGFERPQAEDLKRSLIPSRPGNLGADVQPANTAKDGPRKPVWQDVAKEGSPLALQLEAITTLDPDFSVSHFLNGARIANEMVAEAYAADDKVKLKALLSSDMWDGFARAIDTRVAEKQRTEFKLIGFETVQILEAVLEGSVAEIDVKFLSQMILATYDAQGKLIDGDASVVREVSDIWTFERDLNSPNPNWRVTAIESAV